MDFFNNQVVISLNTPLLILIVLFVLSLLFAIIFLIRKLRKATIYKPKFGFLGKSLYPVVTVALLVVGLGITGLSMNENKIFELKAQKQIQADIYSNILEQKADFTLIDIKAIPYVDGRFWGNTGDKFDIYWDLKGPKEYNFTELRKTNDDRSGIQTEVIPGNYKISITVVFEDSVYIFSKDVLF
jgi:hypothetical protein